MKYKIGDIVRHKLGVGGRMLITEISNGEHWGLDISDTGGTDSTQTAILESDIVGVDTSITIPEFFSDYKRLWEINHAEDDKEPTHRYGLGDLVVRDFMGQADVKRTVYVVLEEAGLSDQGNPVYRCRDPWGNELTLSESFIDKQLSDYLNEPKAKDGDG